MNWLDEVDEVLQQYRGGPTANSPPPTTQSDFSSVAQAAPTSALASGLAAAFRSSQTPPFAQMLGQLFGQSNPAQKAGILGTLLRSVEGGSLGKWLPEMAGNATGSATVTAEQAQQVSPETIQKLAEEAHAADPSVIERASAFYAQHPNVVKGLGAAALAVTLSHLSRQR